MWTCTLLTRTLHLDTGKLYFFTTASLLLYRITLLPGTPASNRLNRYRNGRAPFSTELSSNR